MGAAQLSHTLLWVLFPVKQHQVKPAFPFSLNMAPTTWRENTRQQFEYSEKETAVARWGRIWNTTLEVSPPSNNPLA